MEEVGAERVLTLEQEELRDMGAVSGVRGERVGDSCGDSWSRNCKRCSCCRSSKSSFKMVGCDHDDSVRVASNDISDWIQDGTRQQQSRGPLA